MRKLTTLHVYDVLDTKLTIPVTGSYTASTLSSSGNSYSGPAGQKFDWCENSQHMFTHGVLDTKLVVPVTGSYTAASTLRLFCSEVDT